MSRWPTYRGRSQTYTVYQSDFALRLSMLLFSIYYLTFPSSRSRISSSRRLFQPFILPFAESIPEKLDVWSHQDCIFDKLFHTIHQTITVTTRQEPLISWLTFIWEMGVGPWNRGLIGDRKHTHPATENTQGVNRIERLRSTAHLGNGKRSTLSGTDASSA